jgi:hypothetical protein
MIFSLISLLLSLAGAVVAISGPTVTTKNGTVQGLSFDGLLYFPFCLLCVSSCRQSRVFYQFESLPYPAHFIRRRLANPEPINTTTARDATA